MLQAFFNPRLSISWWSSLTAAGARGVLGVLLDEAIEVVRSVLALALDVLLVVLKLRIHVDQW